MQTTTEQASHPIRVARELPVPEARPGDLINRDYGAGGEWLRVTHSGEHGSCWLIEADEPNGYGGHGYVLSRNAVVHVARDEDL